MLRMVLHLGLSAALIASSALCCCTMAAASERRAEPEEKCCCCQRETPAQPDPQPQSTCSCKQKQPYVASSTVDSDLDASPATLISTPSTPVTTVRPELDRDDSHAIVRWFHDGRDTLRALHILRL